MTAPLLVADVPWLLYRSYFALPKSITGVEGRPVNALLGTVNAILALTGESPPPSGVPRAIVACMGAEQADYRVELYPPYHAHRPPMPPDLAWQWRQAPALLESLAWSVPTSDSLEADDVMCSYALAERERGGRTLLLTADRDLYGAVDEHAAVLELGRGGSSAELGPAEVRARYGVEPGQVPDFIALRGDPSDGLPGSPGIGAKTAAELLREHGSLEGLLDAAHRPVPPLRPRLVGILLEHEDLLRSFKRIATLQRVEASPPPDRATDHAGGAAHARRLGMGRLAERLEKLATA